MSAEASTEAPAAEAGKDTVEPDDLNVGLIATIAIVGALLVIAIAAALTALVRSESTSYGLETGAYADLGKVKRLKADQKAKLEAPIGWADKAKGQVAVPIDRAMELVENDIQRDPLLATVAPPATAAPTTEPVPGTPPAPSGGAPPAASGSALEKIPAGDDPGKSPQGRKKVQEPKAPAPAGGKLVDPPRGAPVTPAAVPALQK
jgi:hypothetical protein